MNPTALILLGLCVIVLIFSFMMSLKNLNTYYKRHKIIEAIGYYVCKCISDNLEPDVSFNDMESYNRTLCRLWDWSYTRILPKEKFEIIKPYIDDMNYLYSTWKDSLGE